MPPTPTETLTGVFSRENWRPSSAEVENGNHFLIASLEDRTSIKGTAAPGDLIPGMAYRFFGKFDSSQSRYGNGKTFLFQAYSRAEPHSRFGLVKYLEKYCPGVGPVTAGRLHDAYGSDACKILRTDPQRVANEIKGFPLDRAKAASAALGELSELEDVKIELTNLFAGRGFPGALIQQVLTKWGPLAPQRIKRDPFTLLVGGLAGAGFARCDRLYNDIGLPPGRIKRQMICLWHALGTDNDGHTWFAVDEAERRLRMAITGARIDLRKAVTLGIRSGWLEVRVDSEGRRWVAHGTKARNERTLAEGVRLLLDGPQVLPRFTEALPGECDRTDQFAKIDTETETAGDAANDDPDDPDDLDHEQLAAIGRKTGICQFCGRRLTNPESLAVGYGPWCAAKYGLPWGDFRDTAGTSDTANEEDWEGTDDANEIRETAFQETISNPDATATPTLAGTSH